MNFLFEQKFYIKTFSRLMWRRSNQFDFPKLHFFSYFIALWNSFSFAFECFRMVPTGAELTIHSPGLSLSHSGSTFCYIKRTKPGFKTLWVSFIVTLTTTPLTPNSIHSKASEEKLKTLTFPHYFVTFTTHSIYFLYFSIVLVRVLSYHKWSSREMSNWAYLHTTCF